jgi:hypothetical protein
LPAAHGSQADEDTDPEFSLNVPAGQIEQASAALDDALYFPAGQIEQAPVEDALPNPALHLQSVSLSCWVWLFVLVLLGHGEQDCAPTEAEFWYVFCAQLPQVTDPVEALNVPSAQAVQAKPSGPVKPFKQVQAVETADAGWLLLLSGQPVQPDAPEGVEA